MDKFENSEFMFQRRWQDPKMNTANRSPYWPTAQVVQKTMTNDRSKSLASGSQLKLDFSLKPV